MIRELVGLGAWIMAFRDFIIMATVREVMARRMAWDFCLFM